MASGKESTASTPELLEPVVVPMSFGEERLWFLHELAEGAPVYSEPIAVRLRGRMDPGLLQFALTAVVERHETLRASFITDRGHPLKLIHPEPDVELETSSIASDPAPLLSELARVPFDLEAPPLLRAHLVRLGDDEHALLLNVHHLLIDDWTVDVLNEEISAHYRAFVESRAAELSPLTIQYADFAAWQREWVLTEPAAQQLDFWVGRLANPPPRLPLVRGTPGHAFDVTGHRQMFMISWALMRAVREAAAAAGVTVSSFLLATYHLLLHSYTDAPEALIGIPVTSRQKIEFERLIGFFVNTVVVRLDAPVVRRFTDHLQLTQQEVNAAFAHGDIPFQRVVKAVCPSRAGAANPLFNVCFAAAPSNVPLDLPGVSVTPEPVDNGTSTFDLTMLIEERRANAVGILEYTAILDEDRWVACFAADYLRLLAVVAGEGTRETLGSLVARVGARYGESG